MLCGQWTLLCWLGRIRCRNHGGQRPTNEAERTRDRPDVAFNGARAAEIKIDETVRHAAIAKHFGQVIEVVRNHASSLWIVFGDHHCDLTLFAKARFRIPEW